MVNATDTETRISPDEYRSLMSDFPTGVVAVTAVRDGRPVGLIIGSFFSASLAPCLIGLCVARTSVTWPVIATGSAFSINILAADQTGVSAALSARDPDKFARLRWTPSAGGSPVIDGALAFLDCEATASHDAGDHVLVIAAVQRFSRLRSAPPLVFYRRGYHTMAGPPVAAAGPARTGTGLH